MKKVPLYLKVGLIAVILWRSITFIPSELPTTIGSWQASSMLIKNNTATPFGEKVVYRYPMKRFAELNTEEQPTEYVIFVLAEASYPDRRNSIRQTWGRNNRHVFFGIAGGFNKDFLRNEFEEHQDMVWIDKENHYRNRAYITMAMIHVLTTHLQNFQYIWKIDDDVYVNTKKLGPWLHHPSPTSGLVGTCTKDAVVVRDPASMWYVPESVFNETRYPPYSVQTYAISRPLSDCISKIIQNADFVAPEDALVGILAHRCQQTCSDVGPSLYEDKPSMYDENITTMVRLGEEATDPEQFREYFIKLHQRSCALGYSLDSSCTNVLALSQLLTEDPYGCHRPCRKYTNRLFYTPPQKRAGLNDRLYILGKLVNIAGYLCATVEFPRPAHLLASKHNNKVSVSIKMKWSDLIGFNTSLCENVTMFSTIPEPLLPLERHFDGSVYPNWTVISTEMYNRTSFSVVEDFIRANETVTSQQEKIMNGEKNAPGFIWVLHDQFYWWMPKVSAFLSERKKQLLEVGDVTRARMLPIGRAGSSNCQQEQLFPPSDRLKRIADMIWDDIVALTGGSKNGTVIGSLYLRRGDAVDQCDTALPTMRDYLLCKFNGTESIEARIVLLLSSDERNATYRDAVVALASSFPNVQGVDLDKMIQQKLDGMAQEGTLPSWLHENNFFVFRIIQVIKGRARFWMIRRRRDQCNPCQGPIALGKLLN